MTTPIVVERKAIVGGVVKYTQETIDCGSVAVIDEDIPNGGATVNVPIDVSQLKALLFQYGASGTLTTDQSQELAIVADVGFLWTESDPAANKPFSLDVATIAVPNTSGSTLKFEGFVGTDPTP